MLEVMLSVHTQNHRIIDEISTSSLWTFFAVKKKGLLVWTPTLNSTPLFSFYEVDKAKASHMGKMLSNLKWDGNNWKEDPS